MLCCDTKVVSVRKTMSDAPFFPQVRAEHCSPSQEYNGDACQCQCPTHLDRSCPPRKVCPCSPVSHVSLNINCHDTKKYKMGMLEKFSKALLSALCMKVVLCLCCRFGTRRSVGVSVETPTAVPPAASSTSTLAGKASLADY